MCDAPTTTIEGTTPVGLFAAVHFPYLPRNPGPMPSLPGVRGRPTA